MLWTQGGVAVDGHLLPSAGLPGHLVAGRAGDQQRRYARNIQNYSAAKRRFGAETAVGQTTDASGCRTGYTGPAEPNLLMKIAPQHGRHTGSTPAAKHAHIGVLQAGFTDIGVDLLHGKFGFDSATDNGMLDMSLYCAMHGYTYMRAVFQPPTDRVWGYGKAKAMKIALHHVDILVTVDFDVAFVELTMPMEDLLLRWGFASAEHLVLAAEEPKTEINEFISLEDGVEKSQLNLNVGFMVLRNHSKVLESLDVFETCVESIPECAAYQGGSNFPHQTAWNKFVLPMFSDDEVVRVPCGEANGHRPEWGENFGCEGTHVHHAGLQKLRLYEMVRDRLLHESFKHTFATMFPFHAAEMMKLQTAGRASL